MKNKFSIISFLIFMTGCIHPVSTVAQAPEKISYQTTIINSNDQPVTNRQVAIRISIQKYVFGMPPKYQNVYIETQKSFTGSNGEITIQIGNGVAVEGNLKNIRWDDGTYYIQTETDPAGGDNYVIRNRTQVVSVPYALQAGEVDKVYTESSIEGSGSASQPLKLAQQSAKEDQALLWDGFAWKPGTVKTLGTGGVDVSKLGVYVFRTSDKVPFLITFKDMGLPSGFDPNKLYILNLEVGWNPQARDLNPKQFRSLKDGIHYEIELFPVSSSNGIRIYYPDKLEYHLQFGRLVYMLLE